MEFFDMLIWAETTGIFEEEEEDSEEELVWDSEDGEE